MQNAKTVLVATLASAAKACQGVVTALKAVGITAAVKPSKTRQGVTVNGTLILGINNPTKQGSLLASSVYFTPAMATVANATYKAKGTAPNKGYCTIGGRFTVASLQALVNSVQAAAVANAKANAKATK